jgi:hypothetical protein
MKYNSGIIYALGFTEADEWFPFYVGRTERPEQRFKEHQYAAKSADDTSTHVYQFIKNELVPLGIEFEMRELEKYGDEGPTDLEDEHIVKLLLDGHSLKNMKKGDANWLAERQHAAKDMKQRGMTSYRKYKERLSYEEQQRKIEEANAKRIAEELAHQAWQEEQAAFQTALQTIREATRLKNIAHAHKIAEEQRIKDEEKDLNVKRRKILEDIRIKSQEGRRNIFIQQETERMMREDEEAQQKIEQANKVKEQSKVINELLNPYYDDNLDVQTYREYAKLLSQYIQTVEMEKPTSTALPQAYIRLKFLTDKIKELA